MIRRCTLTIMTLLVLLLLFFAGWVLNLTLRVLRTMFTLDDRPEGKELTLLTIKDLEKFLGIDET